MKQMSTATDLFQKIRESAGTSYLDRVHQRSFSFNVFQMNAVELLEAAERVKDPDQGIALMIEKNREAGSQAHRELNRHVHNFVSSALTLVEHTRVFMRKHYAGTDLLTTYERQVSATFSQSPVAQFVQGLRNYMLHKGLPDSSMFMSFATSPSSPDGSGTMETGVRYDTAALLDWKDWKPAARSYLEKVGEHLDIHEFSKEYLALVNQFHGWLDTTLAAYHRSDLQELGQLQEQYQSISSTRELNSPPLPSFASVQPFGFGSVLTNEIDQISRDLLDKVRELHFTHTPQGFSSDRPVTKITDQELIGPISMWGPEKDGETALAFLEHEGRPYGLSEGDYEALDSLIDTILKAAWARTTLSRKFVETTFFNWARQRFSSDQSSFPDALSKAAQANVRSIEVWAPIANMEVEQD